jgi:hypothetical protein
LRKRKRRWIASSEKGARNLFQSVTSKSCGRCKKVPGAFFRDHSLEISASMSISLLGGTLPFSSSADSSSSKNKPGAALPFASLFEAASSEARRAADKSILHSVQRANSSSLLAGQPSSPLELQRNAEATLGNLNRRLQQLFQAADVDTSIEVKLVSNASGGIEVAASHPDKEEIEQVLAQHPELAQQFHEMMDLFSRLQASTAGGLSAPASGAMTMIISQQNARIALEPATAAIE